MDAGAARVQDRGVMLFDAHTHFFCRTFFDAMADASPLPGTREERLAGVVERTGLELPDPDVDVHTDRWIAELDANGVDHCVTFASLPVEADAVAQAIARAPERLTGYALVDPTAEDAVAVTETHFTQRGFKGVLMFSAMHRFDPAGAACRAVMEVVAAHHGIAVMHCGLLVVPLRDHLGLPRPMDPRFANPLHLVPLANACRDATIVVPHFGAGMFRETLLLGAQCENVCVDTSSSNSWRATQPSQPTLAEVFRAALNVYGDGRVLFGTDSSTFPRGWRADLYDGQRAALEEAGASVDAQARIFGTNLRERLSRVG